MSIFEDALIDHLRTQVAALRTIRPFVGELVDAAGQIIGENAPAVYCLASGGDPEKPQDAASDEQCEWALLLCVRNLRSRAEAARGSEARDGAYDLIEDLRAALAGTRLPNAQCMPVGVVSWRLYQANADCVVYQLSLSVLLSAETELGPDEGEGEE